MEKVGGIEATVHSLAIARDPAFVQGPMPGWSHHEQFHWAFDRTFYLCYLKKTCFKTMWKSIMWPKATNTRVTSMAHDFWKTKHSLPPQHICRKENKGNKNSSSCLFMKQAKIQQWTSSDTLASSLTLTPLPRDQTFQCWKEDVLLTEGFFPTAFV